MIYKIFAATLLAFTLACTAPSQAENHKPAPPANSLLWKITGNGLTEPSYLFGTIHMICKEDFVWTNAMQQAFMASDEVCMEMDLDDPSTMMETMTGMMNFDGKKLSDYFTPEQYQRLEAFIRKEMGMGLEMLGMMKPVILLTMLSAKGGTACDSTVAYEMILMQKAQAAKKPKEIVGLEPVSEQLEVLNSIPTDSVVKQVMDMVDGRGMSGGDDFDKLVAAYKSQNLLQLDSLINTSSTVGAGGRAVMLDNRNERWVSRMGAQMKKDNTFFAVGAGHLVGPKGMLQLLRNAGYSVEPVK